VYGQINKLLVVTLKTNIVVIIIVATMSQGWLIS